MLQEVKVLQFSTHDEDCGIAKYQQQFVDFMVSVDGVKMEYFKYSPNQTKLMSSQEFQRVLDELRTHLKEFGILHIQHELSFFRHNELKQIIEVAKSEKKKVIVTVHTAPAAQYVKPKLGGLGPRSFLKFMKSTISSKKFIKRYYSPLSLADIVIIHNEPTKRNLIYHGISADKLRIVRHPVPKVGQGRVSSEISNSLQKKKGDTIYATVGFISRSKGILQAIKALEFLPTSYKLAIIGGMHPDSDDTSFYDEVCDLIESLGLEERVYITGFIEDDARLHELVREVDVCVYPYDKRYYSYVSSGSLNTAIANYKPVISYATQSFVEINNEMDVVLFCQSPNYYELARELTKIDINHYTEMSKKYAKMFAWDKETKKLADIYKQLVIEP